MKTRVAAFFVSLLLVGLSTAILNAGKLQTAINLNSDGKIILPPKQSEALPMVPVASECENSWSLVASLNWGVAADWDLHLQTPNAHIYFGNRTADGFTLDRDAHPACTPTPLPPERITGNGQCGTYRLYSHLYSTCGGSPPFTFTATVTILQQVTINGVSYDPGETFTPQDGVDFTVADNPCAVAPLAPLTDPVALSFEAGNTIDTENLNSGMQNAHSCFRQAVTDAGGSFRLNSAYRPPQYQAHLREVWDKWSQLRNNEAQDCQELRTQVQSEFMRHELLETQRPASPTGRHTQGAAIDVSVNPAVTGLSLSTMLTLATGCDLRRPVAASDPVHFELDGGNIQIALANGLSNSMITSWSQSLKNQTAATTSPQVDVRVSVEDLPSGTARYRYTVSNNSTQDVVGVFIGYDYENGTSELLAAPLGWDVDSGIPPSSIELPQGWRASVFTTEEIPFLSVQWIANNASFGLHPGTTVSTFASLLDTRHSEFASAHWAAVLADGQTVSGLITPLATQLGNISTRLRVETGDNVLIGGFIVTGTQPKRIIVRAIGPSLPLAGALSDTVLELRDSSGGLVAFNDDWRTDQQAEIAATGIPPSNILESAIVATLSANNSAYTAIVRGYNNATGIGVVEAYDLDQTVNSKLANISTRGFVSTGDNVMIGGTIILGSAPANILFRAIGPSLTDAGIPNALPDPTLELRDSNGALIAFNDDWRTDQQAEILATGIPPTNILESAILRSLSPGAYTAIVQGYLNSTGVGLVEAYQLQ